MLMRSGVGYLSSPLIEAHGVTHAFLSRLGGVSAPPFDTLNFDARDSDARENIDENKRIISEAFSIDARRLVTVNQVHGDKVLLVDEKSLGAPAPDADAIITALTSVPIGIMTADCLPLVILDPVNRAIGCAHGGWKGTSLSIAAKTLEAMARAFGTRAEQAIAAIGPHIGPCCYEVRENVTGEFSRAFDDTSSYIKRTSTGFTLDLGEATVRQLTGMGISPKSIERLCECTSCGNRSFFSYRKDGGRTGRQLSFITL